jgi:hypothetical protein
MSEIHCHTCGGFITDPGAVSYQVPSGTDAVAPHSALCACIPSVVYGPPPGYVTWPGLTNLASPSALERSRAAGRN